MLIPCRQTRDHQRFCLFPVVCIQIMAPFAKTVIFYFSVAGLLLFLLSFAHATCGEKKIFKQLNTTDMGKGTFLSLYIPWHQLTYILSLSGIGIILAAFKNEFLPLSYFILALILGNLLVFTLLCIIRKEIGLISQSIPQYFLFILLILLLTGGIVSAWEI